MVARQAIDLADAEFNLLAALVDRAIPGLGM